MKLQKNSGLTSTLGIFTSGAMLPGKIFPFTSNRLFLSMSISHSVDMNNKMSRNDLYLICDIYLQGLWHFDLKFVLYKVQAKMLFSRQRIFIPRERHMSALQFFCMDCTIGKSTNSWAKKFLQNTTQLNKGIVHLFEYITLFSCLNKTNLFL